MLKNIALNNLNQSESQIILEVLCYVVNQLSVAGWERKPLFLVLVDFYGANIPTAAKFKLQDFKNWLAKLLCI